MLTILIFSFPIVSWTSLSAFDCYDVGGESRLRANAAVLCGSSEWWKYGIPAICGVVVYMLGVPLLLLYVLRRPDAMRYLARLSSFHPTTQWWLLAQEVWKLVVVLVLRLLLDYPDVQVSLFVVLLALRMAAVLWWWPHANALHNLEESALGLASTLVLFLGIGFYAGRSSLSKEGGRTLFAFVALLLLLMALVVLVCVWLSYKAAKQNQASNATDASVTALGDGNGTLSASMDGGRSGGRGVHVASDDADFAVEARGSSHLRSPSSTSTSSAVELEQMELHANPACRVLQADTELESPSALHQRLQTPSASVPPQSDDDAHDRH
jgi:hypothetical protein